MFYKPVQLIATGDLTKRYNICYRNPLRVPVQLVIEKDSITIRAYIAPHRSMLVPYRAKDGSTDGTGDRKLRKILESMPDPGTPYTFMDAALDGIRECWGKEYTLKGVDHPVKVNVEFIRKDDPEAEYGKRQKFFGIKQSGMSSTSFVASSPWRWGWGFLRTGCPEAAMINWSLRSPGKIHMNYYSSLNNYMHTVSHEFGHILGIGDAYDAHYRCYYEAPGTRDFMMNSNSSVHSQELEMVLRAHMTGKMQFFPFKISLKRFFKRVFKK